MSCGVEYVFVYIEVEVVRSEERCVLGEFLLLDRGSVECR